MSRKRKTASDQDGGGGGGGDKKLAVPSAAPSSSSDQGCVDCDSVVKDLDDAKRCFICRITRVCRETSSSDFRLAGANAKCGDGDEWPLATDRLLDHITRSIGATVLRDLLRLVAQYATPVRERWVFVLLRNNVEGYGCFSTHKLSIPTIAIVAEVATTSDGYHAKGEIVFTPMGTEPVSIAAWAGGKRWLRRLVIARGSAAFVTENANYSEWRPRPTDAEWINPGRLGFTVYRRARFAAVSVHRRSRGEDEMKLLSFAVDEDPSLWPPPSGAPFPLEVASWVTA